MRFYCHLFSQTYNKSKTLPLYMLYVDSHKPFKLLSWCLISPSKILMDFLRTSVSALLSQQWPPQISPARRKKEKKCFVIIMKIGWKILLRNGFEQNENGNETWQWHINYLNVANGYKYIFSRLFCSCEWDRKYIEMSFLSPFSSRHFFTWLRSLGPRKKRR